MNREPDIPLLWEANVEFSPDHILPQPEGCIVTLL
jgi:hypothetical protein